MALPEFEFKHQSTPSDRSVTLADISVAREPLVIDLSSTYPNNQEASISVDSYAVTSSAASISGVVGSFVITDKTMEDGTFLFYEYQPLYDAASSGILVRDKDGFPVPFKMEYARVRSTDTPATDSTYRLSENTATDYDTLEGRSELGIPQGIFAFAPVTNPSGDLGYLTHSDALAAGKFYIPQFDGDDLPEEGTFDYAFYLTDDAPIQSGIYTDSWHVVMGSGITYLEVGDLAGSGIGIANESWYRGRLSFDATGAALDVYQSSLIGANDLIGSGTVGGLGGPIANSGIYISADNTYINNLALFDLEPAFEWTKPAICPRYHHSLRWEDGPVSTTSPYRIRILAEGTDPYFITYDAVKENGTIQQNRTEACNWVPIYKESVVETNEWSRSGDTLLLSGPLADVSNIYLKPVFEGFISVGVIDNHVVVTDGQFKSDPYDVTDGKYVYELLEYDDMMPFTTDNQNTVYPKCVKEVRSKAAVIGAYQIQVEPLFADEGRWPDYQTLETEDINKVVVSGVVTSTTGELEYETWRHSRGIRVYLNGVQLSQDQIMGYDFGQGIIYLGTKVNPSDNVEVTYLRKSGYFICEYPKLIAGITEGSSWRIYLRSSYGNYFLDNPTDTLERLAYKTLVNGQPTGNMKSCVSDETVSVPDETIALADISLIPTITFTDSRVPGGGLKPDTHFTTAETRRTSYPASIFFSDIAGYQTEMTTGTTSWMQIPSLIIRIPSWTRDSILSRFTSTTTGIEYIKKSIEKYIGLGVYYIIIDENNELWDNPYPSQSPDVGSQSIES